MEREFTEWLRDAQARVDSATRAAARGGYGPNAEITSHPGTSILEFTKQQPIYVALYALSPDLANSYAQIKVDLADDHRLSWAGTAHEVREVLSQILRMKAPGEKVAAQPWYKPEPNTSGPSQRQRVRYILEQRGAGSKQRKVAEQAANLESMIGDLVRATYSRASDAAHRFKERNEVQKILRYFEAFAVDLLNIE